MSNPKIKKAVKLLGLLIIISFTLLILPYSSYSQTDTAKLRKELYSLLKKYGLKDASFLLKVESLNQKGGQTAFEINNYNGRENHIVNGPNYGINGNIYNGVEQRRLLVSVFNDMLTKIPSLNTPIKFYVSGGKEGINLAESIAAAFFEKGYKNFSSSNWMDPNGFDKVVYKMNNGTFEIWIYPASNVK